MSDPGQIPLAWATLISSIASAGFGFWALKSEKERRKLESLMKENQRIEDDLVTILTLMKKHKSARTNDEESILQKALTRIEINSIDHENLRLFYSYVSKASQFDFAIDPNQFGLNHVVATLAARAFVKQNRDL